MKHPVLRSILWLVKNGVPYDVAFSLDPTELQAYTIIFGEFEGKKFNWGSMQFEDPS